MYVKHFVNLETTGMGIIGAIIISDPPPPSYELSLSLSSKYVTGGNQMSDLVICCSLVAPDWRPGR